MTNPFEVKLNTKKYAGTLYLEKDFYDDLANLGWDYTAGRMSRSGMFFYDQIMTRLGCLLYTSPSPRDAHKSRMPSSA